MQRGERLFQRQPNWEMGGKPEIHPLPQEESQGYLGAKEEGLGRKLQLCFFVLLTLWLLVSVPTVFCSVLILEHIGTMTALFPSHYSGVKTGVEEWKLSALVWTILSTICTLVNSSCTMFYRGF